jgi:hypothetical protein
VVGVVEVAGKRVETGMEGVREEGVMKKNYGSRTAELEDAIRTAFPQLKNVKAEIARMRALNRRNGGA